MATVVGAEGAETYIYYYEFTPFLILNIMLSVANICALASYKFRMLQMRVSILSAIMMIGYQVWLAVDYFTFKEAVFSPTAIFPLVCVILNILAARAIFLDEAMVQSASRLRGAKRKRK